MVETLILLQSTINMPCALYNSETHATFQAIYIICIGDYYTHLTTAAKVGGEGGGNKLGTKIIFFVKISIFISPELQKFGTWLLSGLASF